MKLLKFLFNKKFRKEISAKHTIEIINRHYNMNENLQVLYKDIFVVETKAAA